MKNKIFKCLCAVMAIAIILSCCSVNFVTYANTEISYNDSIKEICYYISANASLNGDGSETSPFKTVGEALENAVKKADEGNYNTSESTVYFKVLDETPVIYSDISGIEFNFNLNISSNTSGAILGHSSKVNVDICGPITLENVDLQMLKEDEIYLNGNDFTIGDNANVVLPDLSPASACTYFSIGAGATAKILSDPVNVKYADKGQKNITYFSLGGAASTTYNADLNLTFDAPHYQKIRFGTVSSGTAYYNKNINLDFRQSNGIDLETGNIRYEFGKDAALQIINSTCDRLDFEEKLKTALANVPVYIINNNTGIKDVVTFTDTKGKFKVDAEKYQVIAIAQDGTRYEVQNGELIVPAGEYELEVKSKDGNIDYLKRMLYFYTSGDVRKLSSQVYIEAGTTYCYEFSTYCNNFDSMELFVDVSGSEITFENTTKEKINNFYKIKTEITIPNSCDKKSGLIGVTLQDYSEGVIFDRTFYKKNDSNKSDRIVENQKLQKGLDGIKLGSDFWGNIYTGDRGGGGVTFWSNGVQVLKTVYYDTGLIQALVSLSNPDDSEWWDKAFNDINGVKDYDICDLVFANGLIGVDFTQESFNSVAEKNKDNVIDTKDISIIRTELLTNTEYHTTPDFSYKGYAENERNTLLNKILTVDSTEERCNIAGNAYFVSTIRPDSMGLGSSSEPLKSLEDIPALKAGDAVFFECGSVFRLKETFDCVAGVTYGSYGTGEKPMFLGSQYNFADGIWIPSQKQNVWKVNYTSENDIAGGFFNDGKEIGIMKSSIRALYKNMDFYYDKDNALIYLYCDKGNPSDVWNNIEFSQAGVHIRMAPRVENVTIDDLCLKYMGTFGISAEYDNHFITVTNCEIGFIGGTMMSVGTRYGNGIQTWCGGHDLNFNNNWLYQVFDTAIAPHGAAGHATCDFYNVSICENLFEYNNGDIEFWEAGANMSGQNVSQFYNWKMDGNIHRFNSLGWGTRKEEGSRGIQGVHVGQIRDHNIKNMTWNNNIIDCPGEYIFNKNCHYEDEYNAFERKNNTYYIKQSMRNTDILTLDFCWYNGTKIDNVATNSTETLTEFAKLEPNSKVYWYE